MSTENILTLIVALIAASPGILAFWKTTRRDKAEITKLVTEAASTMIDKLQTELKEAEAELKLLKEEVRVLRAENTELNERCKIWMRGISILIGQVHDCKQTPLWVPEGMDG